MQLPSVLAGLVSSLLLADAVIAGALTTVDPCPAANNLKLAPITVTAQYQQVSTCQPSTACVKGKCSTQYPLTTYPYVSTVVPCAWDGTTSQKATVTDVAQPFKVSEHHSIVTITSQAPAVENHGFFRWLQLKKVKAEVATAYETVTRRAIAPYSAVGPFAIPGWKGSGLCKKCKHFQLLDVVECRYGTSGSGKTYQKCSEWFETWSQPAAPTSTVTTSALCSSQGKIPKAGTYTWTFPQSVPAVTITAKPGKTYTVPGRSWDACVTRSFSGSTTFSFNIYITKVIIFKVPHAIHPAHSTRYLPIPSGAKPPTGGDWWPFPNPDKNGGGYYGGGQKWSDWNPTATPTYTTSSFSSSGGPIFGSTTDSFSSYTTMTLTSETTSTVSSLSGTGGPIFGSTTATVSDLSSLSSLSGTGGPIFGSTTATVSDLSSLSSLSGTGGPIFGSTTGTGTDLSTSTAGTGASTSTSITDGASSLTATTSDVGPGDGSTSTTATESLTTSGGDVGPGTGTASFTLTSTSSESTSAGDSGESSSLSASASGTETSDAGASTTDDGGVSSTSVSVGPGDGSTTASFLTTTEEASTTSAAATSTATPGTICALEAEICMGSDLITASTIVIQDCPILGGILCSVNQLLSLVPALLGSNPDVASILIGDNRILGLSIAPELVRAAIDDGLLTEICGPLLRTSVTIYDPTCPVPPPDGSTTTGAGVGTTTTAGAGFGTTQTESTLTTITGTPVTSDIATTTETATGTPVPLPICALEVSICLNSDLITAGTVARGTCPLPGGLLCTVNQLLNLVPVLLGTDPRVLTVLAANNEILGLDISPEQVLAAVNAGELNQVCTVLQEVVVTVFDPTCPQVPVGGGGTGGTTTSPAGVEPTPGVETTTVAVDVPTTTEEVPPPATTTADAGLQCGIAVNLCVGQTLDDVGLSTVPCDAGIGLLCTLTQTLDAVLNVCAGNCGAVGRRGVAGIDLEGLISSSSVQQIQAAVGAVPGCVPGGTLVVLSDPGCPGGLLKRSTPSLPHHPERRGRYRRT